MVSDVISRVGLAEAGQGITQGDPLVEGGEGPETKALAQQGLAGQHQGEGAGRVHVGIRELGRVRLN